MKDLLTHIFSWLRVFLSVLPVLFLLACDPGPSATTDTRPTAHPETPGPDQTVSGPSSTPTPESPATPTPTPIPPTMGTVTGRITFLHRTGDLRPDTDATVELVGNTSSSYFSSGTNSAGEYTLADIPPGQYWVMARSPIGSSNPQEVQVDAGETISVDLRTFTGFPMLTMRPAGGRILVDGQPVAGAKVWRFGGLIESDKLAVSDASGFFSFPYVADTPVIAASGDRWTVTTLQPDAVIDIELERTGAHPTPPDGPVVTPVPVDEDVIIRMPTPPVIRATRLIPEVEIILPTPPITVEPVRPIPEVRTVVPVRPTLVQPQR